MSFEAESTARKEPKLGVCIEGDEGFAANSCWIVRIRFTRLLTYCPDEVRVDPVIIELAKFGVNLLREEIYFNIINSHKTTIHDNSGNSESNFI